MNPTQQDFYTNVTVATPTIAWNIYDWYIYSDWSNSVFRPRDIWETFSNMTINAIKEMRKNKSWFYYVKVHDDWDIEVKLLENQHLYEWERNLLEF